MKKEQVCAAAEKKVVERTPCCEKMGLKKGPWTPEEDQILVSFVHRYGHGNWRALPKQAGLLRCGKSCRLRWINYLRPDIKRGNFSNEEEETIIKLHQILGNRWSAIAAKLPGRTDNEIKNYWHTRLKKRPNFATKQAQQHCSNGIIQSPGDIQPVSQQKFRPEIPDSMDTITTGLVADVSPGKVSGVERKCVARDVALMEAMKCDSSSDMEFWYNVFMKTGNSIEVQGNLDSMDR